MSEYPSSSAPFNPNGNEQTQTYVVVNPQSKLVQNQPQWIPPPSSGLVAEAPNIYRPSLIMNPELENIRTYQGWSIFNIFCCCLCFGLLACFYSNKTSNFKVRGDLQGALNASRNARTINTIATVLGIIILIINLIYYNKYA